MTLFDDLIGRGFDEDEPDEDEDEGLGDFGAFEVEGFADEVEALRFFGPLPAGPSSSVRECNRV